MFTEEILFFARSLGGGVLAGGIAFSVGRRGFRLLGVRFDSAWEEFSCSTAGGLGALALVAFALGTAGILRRDVCGGVLALLVLLSLIPLRRTEARGDAAGPGAALHRTALCIMLILAIPLAVLPLYPPTGPDAITYHLAVARKFAASAVVSPTPEFRYAVFPELAEMLFTGGFLFGNDGTAQWMSFLALAVTVAAVAAFVRRLGGESAALAGPGLLLSNSALLLLGAAAYSDMVLTAFVTVALFSFERWRGGGGERWLTVSGLMAGLAAGTKYSALFFPPVLLVMTVAAGSMRRAVRPVLMFLLPCAITALPWYLYILYHTGNPVWPFFSGVFGLRYWNGADIAAQTSDLVSRHGSGKSLAAFLTLPWNLFAHGELFHTEGTFSLLLIAGLPLALLEVVRDGSARRLSCVAAAYTVFWFCTAQILRYLIPVVPLYCAIVAAGAGRFLRRFVPPGILPAVSAALAVVLLLPCLYFTLLSEGRAGLPPSTAGERDRFLEKRLPSYGAVRFLNARSGSAYTLYSYNDPQMAYFVNGNFRGDFFGPWRYSRLEGALNAPEDTLLDMLHDLGADYLLVREEGAGSGCRDEWLTRRYVVPWYRSPAVALFYVSPVPLAPSFGPDLVSPNDTTGNGVLTGTGIRFAATEGRMYYCICAGSVPREFVNAILQISWFDERGTRIRTDEAPGMFSAKASVLSLISTSPPDATGASVALAPFGGINPAVTRVSVRELRFVPLQASGIEQ